MEKIQKYIACDTQGFYIIQDEDFMPIPMFCDVCDFIISSNDDIKSHTEYKCCHNCFLSFAESRKEDWNRGWRPDKRDLKKYKNIMRVKSPAFILS